jgi:hypothetical protein
MRATTCALLSSVAASAFLCAPEAFAADTMGTMLLDYRRDVGAEACPDEQEFRDAMTAHVRRPLFAPASDHRLVVRVQARGGWYRGIAELRDTSGKPAWTIPIGPVPRDCSSVVDSLALSIAIRVDPGGATAAAQASAPAVKPAEHRWFGVDGEVLPMPQPPAANTAPAPDAIVPAPAPATEAEIRARLGASGGVALASVPGWAPSVGVDVGLRWRDRPLSVAVEASFVPPGSADVMSGPHVVHVTAYRITGAGVACGHFLRYLFACGVAAAGALHGTGTSMNLVAQPATAFYFGVGGRGGVEIPLHPHVAVRVSADAIVTVARPVIQAGAETVYQASIVSGTAAGGVVFTF